MHKNINNLYRALSLTVVSLTLAATALSGSLPVSAEYKSELSRYEDSLNTTNTDATYNYNYENTSDADAPGYFELSLEKLAGLDAKNLIEVKSITETTPIDYVTKQATGDAKTTEFKVSDAVYEENGTLKIRISPQSECKKRDQGGCEDGMIPAAKPSKITIKIGLKSGIDNTPSVIFGTGRIFFPNGFDINQIGWKINVNSADESAVDVPVIKDEIVDSASLEANAAMTSNPTSATTSSETVPTMSPAAESKPNSSIEKTDDSNSVSKNTQNLTSSPSTNSASSTNNNVVVAVIAITALAVLIGAGLFMISRQKKVKKAE